MTREEAHVDFFIEGLRRAARNAQFPQVRTKTKLPRTVLNTGHHRCLGKEQAYTMLKKISGEDWGYDAEAWETRRSIIAAKIELPSPEDLRKRENELRKHRRKKHRTGPSCPQCGEPLQTEQAQQCFECGADWH